MRVITFIEDEDIGKKILNRLGLYKVKRMSRPRANAPSIDVFPVYEDPLGTIADDYIIDPDYPPQAYF